MNFMMQFVNLMRNDPFEIGNFWVVLFNCHDRGGGGGGGGGIYHFS